jgi:hypothetical protein
LARPLAAGSDEEERSGSRVARYRNARTERRSARRRCVPVGVGTPVAAVDAARDELPELLEAWHDDLLAGGPVTPVGHAP